MSKPSQKSKQAALASISKQIEEWTLLAKKQYDIGEYEAAFELCQKIIKSDATQISVLVLLGKLAAQFEQVNLAKQFFMQVLHQVPNDANSLLELAKVFWKEGETKKAQLCFESAIKQESSGPLLHYYYAQFLYDQKRYEESLSHLTYLIESQPNWVEAHVLLGRIFLEEAKLEEAKMCFSRAFSIRAQSPDALIGLGLVCLMQHHFFEAIDYFEQALVIDTNHEEAYYYLGEAFSACERYPDAMTAFKAVLALNPQQKAAQKALKAISVACQNR